MTPDNLLRQAKMTGAEYLDAAIREMKEHSCYFDGSFDNCMRLAELMVKNFETMTRSADMEHLCCALERISDFLKDISNSLEDA